MNSDNWKSYCIELKIQLCGGCEKKSACWIDTYAANVKSLINRGVDIKQELISIIKNSRISLPHLVVAIEMAAPEYHNWFQKVLILK